VWLRERPPRWFTLAIFLLTMMLLPAVVSAGVAEEPLVHALTVDGVVDAGMTMFLERALQDAERAGADYVLLDISTLGGTVDAALDLRDTLLASRLTTIAYVRDRAWSAGVVITIACDKVVMAPAATLGAAEPRPAEEKYISAWRAELEATARARGRDPRVAAAMADKSLVIEDVVGEGKLLTLGADQARDLGFIDAVAEGRNQALAELGIGSARVEVINPTTTERWVQFVTSPLVAPFILALGVLGLLVELVVPGFGAPGLLGVIALGAYFAGHMSAGLAGWEAILLFALGIVLLVAELFVAGFGVLGAAGLASIAGSVFLASPTPAAAVRSLVVALASLVLGAIVLFKFGYRLPFYRQLSLAEEQRPDQGYLAPADLKALVGQEGITLSPLRPAGTARIGAERVDVVSQGGFIPSGRPVQVVGVQGSRVVVEEREPENAG